MTVWTSEKIKTNGIDIHYRRTGGDKPPLVLAHGITDSALAWTRTTQALEDEFDVIMVDARGHGYSDKPEQGYSSTDHAADLAGLITGLGLGKVPLIGHSMGARSVATLAAVYPDIAERIVLEDPPWRPADEASTSARRRFGDLIAMYQGMSREEIIAYGREHNPTWDDEELGLWSAGKMLVSPNVVAGTVSPQLWLDVVPKIGCPTLLVTADPEKGGIVTPETAQAVVGVNLKVQVVRIDNAGHNIRRDQTAAYVAAIRPFLKQE